VTAVLAAEVRGDDCVRTSGGPGLHDGRGVVSGGSDKGRGERVDCFGLAAGGVELEDGVQQAAVASIGGRSLGGRRRRALWPRQAGAKQGRAGLRSAPDGGEEA
jgi:hypothetical protein